MKLNGGRTSPACLFEFLAGILLLAGFVKPAAAEVALKRVASGFESPVYMADPNDGTGRLFVVELGGIVKILQNGRVRRTPFLDLRSKITSAGEQGLLGFAFDPTPVKTEMAGIERLRGSLTFMCIPMAPTISVASPAEAGRASFGLTSPINIMVARLTLVAPTAYMTGSGSPYSSNSSRMLVALPPR